jgi:S-adenosylmethionine synthetase
MIKSAESVSPKHPDKLCDRISDTILDEALRQDPNTRAAIEVMGGHGKLVIMGELSTTAKLDIEGIARPFVTNDYEIITSVDTQSHEIAAGVDTGGAGDQGVMVGYATSESPALIPLETWLARELNRRLYAKFSHDGKTQITLADGRISAIVASFQQAPTVELRQELEAWLRDKKTVNKPLIHVNPAGYWEIGGFEADTGLTGRKLAVDNYGPGIPLGGGCFSGKDATKVDRSAAYMARRVAVDLLRHHGAQEVFVTLAYAIGVAEPVHAEAVIDGHPEPIKGYNLTPVGIIELLKLREPQFASTAEYGHFGNDFSWDKY